LEIGKRKLEIRNSKSEIRNQKSKIKNFQSPRQRVVRPLAGLVLVAFVLFTLLTFGLSLEQYFKPQPAFFNADALKLREIERRVAPNAEIFLTDRAEVQKIPMGLAAYALLQNSLRGNVTTGYGKLENVAPNQVYSYALLARGEDPATRGYQNKPLWQNETFALYPRESGVLIHQPLNQWQNTATRMELTVDENGIPEKEKAISRAPAQRALTVALLTFTPQSITVQAGEQRATVDFKPGLNLYSFPRVNLPTTLALTPKTAGSLRVAYVQLREPDSVNAGLESSKAMVISCWGSKANLSARCNVVNPQKRTLTWKWIVRGALAGTHEERVVASGEALGAPLDRVRIDVGARGDLQAIRFDDQAPIHFTNQKLPSGDWRAAVEVWDGNTLLARFDAHPLLQVQGNGMTWRESQDLPPAIIQPQ
jgi:hypothetical protein